MSFYECEIQPLLEDRPFKPRGEEYRRADDKKEAATGDFKPEFVRLLVCEWRILMK